MSEQEAALRRLAGMLGSDAFERLGMNRSWMTALMTELRFLEEMGFTFWAEGRADARGDAHWAAHYQRRLLHIEFRLDEVAHRVVATFHQPTMGFDAGGGWSLGPPVELGAGFSATGIPDAGTDAIAHAVAAWRSTLEDDVALFDDALTEAERAELAEANLERAAPPPIPPPLSDEELKRQPWWWRRYAVELTRDDGTSFRYTMVTNQGPTKALAWAIEAAGRPRGQLVGAGPAPRVQHAQVTDEGPIDVDADGIAVLPDDAHHDRMEF